MNNPITIEWILAIFGIAVSVVAFFKALEWVIEKINNKHDKDQKIDANSDDLEDYKKKTDTAIEDLKTMVINLENSINSKIDEQNKEYMQNLRADKEEYLECIRKIDSSIMEMQAVYQQTVAIVDIKIENLTKQVEKHNSVVERTYALEKDVAILKNNSEK